MALLKDHKETLMTGEELFHQPDLGPCELVNGRILPLTPTGHVHGFVESTLTRELGSWVKENRRGRVLSGEVGIYIRRNPDTVRAADVLFISNDRLASQGASGYLDVAPELVVEVLSPEDRWSEVTEKIQDYFAAGVARVWVVDPKRRKLHAYRSPSEVEQFGEGQILTDEELLPGFSVPVAEIFSS
jgi:Uma2 family endonuclease